MSLKIGIVGLPNVGKSTLFNALTQAQNAQAANYPFCTIEPNQAVVTVPDERVEHLRQMVNVDQAIHATIDFVDVAGLVEGASRGEGLGNQFLGNIRDVDAILHVVRCFDDPNVVHIREKPDPAADIAIIQTELALADWGQIERRIDKLERDVKGNADLAPRLALARDLAEHLSDGHPLWTHPQRETETFAALNQEMRFLTAKPTLYVANVAETGADTAYVAAVKEAAAAHGAEVVVLCAQLEQEMAGLPDDERAEYLALYDIESSGLDKVLRASYRLLGLISYFSFNDEEVRAWTIQEGWTATQAAGVIHTDFERGFISAEVIPYATFADYGDRAAVRAAGKMRVEGSTYVVQDGDVILFRFNV